jgi:hypothetical protein
VPITDGPERLRGRKLDRKKFEKMKDEYYAMRQWDIETGLPLKKTLIDLDLKDVADSLDKLGKLPKPKTGEELKRQKELFAAAKKAREAYTR